MNQTITRLLALSPVAFGCAPPSSPAVFPASWHVLPEDGELSSQNESTSELEPYYGTLIESQSEALPSENFDTASRSPSPWQLSYLITDLGLSAQGVFGFLLK